MELSNISIGVYYQKENMQVGIISDKIYITVCHLIKTHAAKQHLYYSTLPNRNIM